MKFITNGDFQIPFDFGTYLAQHIYTWSFQTGALNPNGILRLLSQLPVLFFFYITKNPVLTAYFYLIFVLSIGYFSFYFFLRTFVGLEKKLHTYLLPLFYIFNPVYLGNFSKIGLILGIVMLPLILTFLKRYVEDQKPRSLMLLFVCLNVSLVHPFIFIVNSLIGCIYVLYKFIQDRKTIAILMLWKTWIIVFVSFASWAYCVLPLISLNTLQKASIVNNLDTGQVDVEGLLWFANTGGLVNSFAMVKPVLLDFDFFDPPYEEIYYEAAFFLLTLLFLCYLFKFKKLPKSQQLLFLFMLILFLIMVWLPTVDWLWSGTVLNKLNNLPGGWSFRSPLKWQMYLPLAIYSMYAVLLEGFTNTRERKLVILGLTFAMIILNFHLITNIYKKLLIPKNTTIFTQYIEHNPEVHNKRFLFVEDASCQSDSWNNAQTEFNQEISSKDIQVKNVNISDLNIVYAQDFDFIFTCKYIDLTGFTLLQNYSNQSFYLYKNAIKMNFPIYAVSDLYKVKTDWGLEDSIALLNKKTGFLTSFITTQPNTGTVLPQISPLFDMEDVISLVKNGYLEKTYKVPFNDKAALYFSTSSGLEVNNMPVSGSIFKTDISQSQADLKNEREDKLSLDSMQLTGLNKFVFRDSKYTYKNVISNGSFEEGLWQTSVSDCYDYDNNPVLEMKLDTFEHSEGGQSLQLEAKRHIACTSQTFALERGTYLFNIDYQSPNAQAAYFYLKLNDAQGTVIQEKLLITDSGWHSHTELIDIPPGTSSATIYLYAHSADKLTNVINRYDNISLVRVPELRNTFYIINDPQLNLKDPASVTFDLVNPTKKLVHVRGATTPFYLAFSESFHPQWQLQLDNAKVHGFLSGWWPFARPDRVSDSFHFALDDFLNAWYVDPVELCGVAGSGAQVAPAYSDAIATQGSSGGGASSSFDFGLSTSSLTSYAPLPSSGFESVSSTLPVVLSPILLTIPGHSTTTISTSTPSTRVTLVPNAALRPGCTRNADGSYDIELVIEFWPQRWFYLGLLISATTLATCLSYLTFIGIRTLRRRLH